jgi:RimJ/RimL family protein N-acetyltransferase
MNEIAGKKPPEWSTARNAQLENVVVLLRPLVAADRDELRSIAFDPDIWRYFVLRIEDDGDLDKFIGDSLREMDTGNRVVFSIIVKAAGAIAGSMSFLNMSEKEKRLEIGGSWLGSKFRGSGVNHWAKYLMLQYCFETLGCERVEFKTDVLNKQARKGLLNIGATEEGVLRSFNFMPDNRRRDAIFYSILKNEWPDVKAMLLRGPKKSHAAPSIAG